MTIRPRLLNSIFEYWFSRWHCTQLLPENWKLIGWEEFPSLSSIPSRIIFSVSISEHCSNSTFALIPHLRIPTLNGIVMLLNIVPLLRRSWPSRAATPLAVFSWPAGAVSIPWKRWNHSFSPFDKSSLRLFPSSFVYLLCCCHRRR